MKCWSFLLSSLLLSVLLPPPPARSAATQTLLRAATGGEVTAARLLGFGVPRLFLRGVPKEEEEENDEEEMETDEERTKFKTRREYAPLSIDLTFHLLRSMIHNARMEEKQVRAQVNQKLLDEVGK
ncbi:urotensin 1 [Syngnathus typhle]|uniref:urotensin 1 n=1 Tax=Syngnathus typhle TaxID=161592 RepID=UPI002A6A9CEF|nr:urotensin 1 [Syngnathus typhle]